MQTYDKIFIDGQWISSTGSEHIDVICSSTEEVMGRIPAGTPEDANKAVAAAQAAFQIWSEMQVSERANVLRCVAKGLKSRSEEIGATIAQEVGMPIRLAVPIQATNPADNLKLFADLVEHYDFEEKIHNSLIIREPLGVIVAITPWNYPLHQLVAKVAPALAAGNTVVVKPSEVAPLSAFVLAEEIERANVPNGVFNLVSGYGPIVGEAMASHASVDMVSFTGSTRAGTRVSELASKTVKRVALELGGKSASILLSDADFGKAVKSTVNQCYLNSGQTCNAMTRMLVATDQYEEVAELAVQAADRFSLGDPLNEETRLGPLVSETQRDRVRGFIQKGIEEGAKLLTGGAEPPLEPAKGFFVKPTVFGNVTPDMTIAQEEIFGPVLSIMSYTDVDDAVRIANSTQYGLGSAIWSEDEERAMSIARRMQAGSVDINGGPFNMHAPFGGYKKSGNGRELGKYGLEEFLELKSVQLKPRAT